MASCSRIVSGFLIETSILTGIPVEDLYCTQNGKRVNRDDEIEECVPLRWAVRLVGGKGGFGSMLRAIGAQIEKTTNREACRDLSGRRLRDIREERRLLDWAASQPQREEEARQRKEQRIKRLCAPPKHEFHDEAYETSRRKLEEDIDEAVEKGSQAGPSTSGIKNAPKRKKPAKLWIDEDLSDLSDEDSEDEKRSDNGSGGHFSESDGSKNEEEEPVVKRSKISEPAINVATVST